MLHRGPWKWLRPGRKLKKGVVLRDVPRRIIWGRRSHLDGVAWICPTCEHKNLPSRELFVDLPAFKCSKCNTEKRENFHFSFGNLAANRRCPIGKILDQGRTDDCLPFALAKGAEMTDRIFGTLSGSHLIVPTMDPYSLKDTFRHSRLADGIEQAEINYQDKAAMKGMIKLLQTVGVQDEDRQYTCKIGGVERVGGYFEDIVKVLANGYPLTVDIMTGGEFDNLKYGQVYQCPFNNRTIKEGSKVMMHTVILVGAARLGDVDYFYFLNSAGESWCVRVHKKTEKRKIGGIGRLFANDICCRPYKFLRMAQP